MFLHPAKNQGWTLLEVAVVTVIAGILAALGGPSMTGMMGRGELKSATDQLKGALQEAQRNAIKRGSSCTVTLTSTTATGSPAGCVSIPVTFTTGIAQTFNGTGSNVVFSYKGNTTGGSSRTIVLTSSKTIEKRCIVISNGIGLFRSGKYTGTPFTGTCNTQL